MRVLPYASIVLIIGLFSLVGERAGIRGMGIMVLISTALSYGWMGQPPSGYLTGFPKLVYYVLIVALCVTMIAVPELLLNIAT